MRLTQDVFLQQQQKLLMTPELRQAIAILQMSTLELGEYIENELQENPFSSFRNMFRTPLCPKVLMDCKNLSSPPSIYRYK